MNWFTGCVLYILIWWVTLFAVLPIGTQAVERPDEVSGWRGAPARPYSTESAFARHNDPRDRRDRDVLRTGQE